MGGGRPRRFVRGNPLCPGRGHRDQCAPRRRGTTRTRWLQRRWRRRSPRGRRRGCGAAAAGHRTCAHRPRSVSPERSPRGLQSLREVWRRWRRSEQGAGGDAGSPGIGNSPGGAGTASAGGAAGGGRRISGAARIVWRRRARCRKRRRAERRRRRGWLLRWRRSRVGGGGGGGGSSFVGYLGDSSIATRCSVHVRSLIKISYVPDSGDTGTVAAQVTVPVSEDHAWNCPPRRSRRFGTRPLGAVARPASPRKPVMNRPSRATI